MMRTLLVLVFCFQVSCLSKKHDLSEEAIGVAELKNDFDVLRKTLDEVHPGLYWYSNKATMDHFLDSAKMSIDRAMTRNEFFKFLLPVIANIKCVHTNLRLSSATDPSRYQFTHLLPFDFYCQNGSVYITKDFYGTGQERKELLAINNTGTGEIIHTLLRSLPADGYNETYKYSLLNKGAFREGYALFYGQPERFTIRVKDNRQQMSSVTAKAISPQQLTHTPGPTLPAFKLNVRQRTAVLAINTFNMNTAQFGDSLSNLFRAIRQHGSKQLIIDLRQNGGGTNDNVSKLYSYMATAPFLHLKRAEMKARNITYHQFISNAKSLNVLSTKSDTGEVYSVTDTYAGTKVQYPASENSFKGEVLLLTNGNTISAASEFAAIAHFRRRAKILGEETGGCYYGATGGYYVKLTLPHTGLEVRIPTVRILTAVDEDYRHQPKGRGTLPDYQLSPSVEDVLAGRDSQLDRALKILAN